MKQPISSPDAPAAGGAYSPALRVGQLLFMSGQIPIDPKTGQLVSGDAAACARRVMENLGALLKAAGLDFSKVVRTTIYLADINDFNAVNEVYSSYFGDPKPARVTVQAAALPRGARIEIDAIASYDA